MPKSIYRELNVQFHFTTTIEHQMLTAALSRLEGVSPSFELVCEALGNDSTDFLITVASQMSRFSCVAIDALLKKYDGTMRNRHGLVDILPVDALTGFWSRVRNQFDAESLPVLLPGLAGVMAFKGSSVILNDIISLKSVPYLSTYVSVQSTESLYECAHWLLANAQPTDQVRVFAMLVSREPAIIELALDPINDAALEAVLMAPMLRVRLPVDKIVLLFLAGKRATSSRLFEALCFYARSSGLISVVDSAKGVLTTLVQGLREKDRIREELIKQDRLENIAVLVFKHDVEFVVKALVTMFEQRRIGDAVNLGKALGKASTAYAKILAITLSALLVSGDCVGGEQEMVMRALEELKYAYFGSNMSEGVRLRLNNKIVGEKTGQRVSITGEYVRAEMVKIVGDLGRDDIQMPMERRDGAVTDMIDDNQTADLLATTGNLQFNADDVGEECDDKLLDELLVSRKT